MGFFGYENGAVIFTFFAEMEMLLHASYRFQAFWSENPSSLAEFFKGNSKRRISISGTVSNWFCFFVLLLSVMFSLDRGRGLGSTARESGGRERKRNVGFIRLGIELRLLENTGVWRCPEEKRSIWLWVVF